MEDAAAGEDGGGDLSVAVVERFGELQAGAQRARQRPLLHLAAPRPKGHRVGRPGQLGRQHGLELLDHDEGQAVWVEAVRDGAEHVRVLHRHHERALR
eukprot:jgi/Chrpa1/1597/Chrysochromulina_OHIO_Genome00018232-RA